MINTTIFLVIEKNEIKEKERYKEAFEQLENYDKIRARIFILVVLVMCFVVEVAVC